MRSHVNILVLLPFWSALTFAQPRPMFEVASIRTHPPSAASVNGQLSISGTRLTIEGYSLFGLVMFAYSVKNFQVANAASLDHTMYDIAAIADEIHAGKREDLRLMMQHLLAERFKLQVHWEKRDVEVYALVVGKNGPKFHESAPDASTKPAFEIDGSNIVTTIPKATMENVADRIGGNAGLGVPVIDRTGLTGSYEIRLAYTPASRRGTGPQADSNEIGIFNAVQDQLGLRLEKRRDSVRTLVIDRSERASEN